MVTYLGTEDGPVAVCICIGEMHSRKVYAPCYCHLTWYPVMVPDYSEHCGLFTVVAGRWGE